MGDLLVFIRNNKMLYEINKMILKKVSQKNSLIQKDYYDNHIIICTYFAYLLALIQKCDIEVAVISALLHDYARINQEWCDKHEYYGALEAEKLLNKYNYDKEKIELVKKSILNHKVGVRNFINNQIQITADADAISYIKRFSYFKNYEMSKSNNLNDTRNKLKLKLEDIYDKISVVAKQVIENDYKMIKKELEE